ncbi:uncharacterized protein MYCFIDRAFT_175525 [Pseudocercospora fijiensis CIRAD86]|uniref:Uncharacterized protein n=1 Tax=Pseudocercospora fijiensis (strain CIRAD86) TaxID=383855 RepID=M2YW53_PSEFD|nr:uncharacterized protein MYCFIDRAFT_175525 [Pseudocercospora fijiensis CIRAD86]EME81950.1 hypothetical protein MYCFIDRAFT_175525 [Pseudocercospora fijiensis CIRAD86]
MHHEKPFDTGTTTIVLDQLRDVDEPEESLDDFAALDDAAEQKYDTQAQEKNDKPPPEYVSDNQSLLQDTRAAKPSIVIGDEGHHFKNKFALQSDSWAGSSGARQPGLAFLVDKLLGEAIQSGGEHSPVEDADATRKIDQLRYGYDLVAEARKGRVGRSRERRRPDEVKD